ncbi:MAG: ImmA/IrrE family metallo-endopeptidase [Pseudomonadota bacterium]
MNMIKVLKTDSEHAQAVQQLLDLMDLDPESGSKEADELELLALVIEKYEANAFPIEDPSPIEAIKFRMEQEGLTQRDLIPYIGSLPKVSEVLSGKRKLSLNMIKKLSSRLGISADVLIATPMDDLQEKNIDWLKFPLAEMRKRAFFKTNESLSEIKIYAEERIKTFLGEIPVGMNLSQMMLKTTVHYRYNNKEIDRFAVWVWQARVLQLAEQEPLKVSYQKGTISQEFMKDLSQLSWSDNGPIIAKEFLNKHGVHLIIEPHFKQTYLDGAVCIGANGSPIIALTLRHDRLDNFWFTLMHELAHIALHFDGNIQWFLDDLDVQDQDPKEIEADSCARNSLIQIELWQSKMLNSVSDIINFAKKIKIHPSIVIGRLRREMGDYSLYAKTLKIPKVRHFFIA